MAQTKDQVVLHPVGFVDSRFFYRILEIIPGLITWMFLLSPIILSFAMPIAVAYFIIAFDIFWLLKSLRMSFSLVRGYQRTHETEAIDWNDRLYELTTIEKSLQHVQDRLVQAETRGASKTYRKRLKADVERLQLLYKNQQVILNPKDIYHCIIMPLYNEPIEVIRPSINAILDSEYPNSKIIFVLTYEERGGDNTKKTAQQLQKEFKDKFGEYQSYCHPDGVPGELKGKGANITFAGRKILKLVNKKRIDISNVIVTTIDCDNIVHKQYLSRLSYAFCSNPNRRHRSFQPLALYFNNIWDVPAPIRVIATGNSFWIMIESVRQNRLRNFASHAQGLDALVDTDFWSIITPVEDGHQFYRSYFRFDGDYAVEPLFLPITESAVQAGTYRRTFKIQFKQLQRWAYGVSDFPFVVKNSIKDKKIPMSNKLLQIGRLFEGHFSWATAPLILTFAAWAPLYLNRSFNRQALAHQLPVVASNILTVAMLGLFVTIWMSFIMLPKRPAHQKWYKIIFMVLQWVLVPITAIVFGAFASISAQTRLMFGRYLGFTVTEKAIKK